MASNPSYAPILVDMRGAFNEDEFSEDLVKHLTNAAAETSTPHSGTSSHPLPSLAGVLNTNSKEFQEHDSYFVDGTRSCFNKLTLRCYTSRMQAVVERSRANVQELALRWKESV